VAAQACLGSDDRSSPLYPEEIDDRLGGNWTGTLWGCAFEDFLTRRFAPDGRNPVEAYLERRS
jgi:hypothetical protein